ncbi:DNA replication complex GINS protein PSF3 [Fukomys damarensis]|uniref:DNA replication complex GINS protein PSF3 n=1 Tax=Fukomys damarensis TaxID=885580 RepID=UPI0008FEB431|nr:DNA replication complex GINS protein PSF3 [Fukomys damarensis]
MSEAYYRVESGALGLEENFLSLDDILMSHEKLPVRTETPLPRLGTFFPEWGAGSGPDHALPQGSKLELPLWLVKGLFDNKRRILSVELPKIYQEGWRTVFSADANVVDLHKMGPHFYGYGSQLLHFDSPDALPQVGTGLAGLGFGGRRPTGCDFVGLPPTQVSLLEPRVGQRLTPSRIEVGADSAEYFRIGVLLATVNRYCKPIGKFGCRGQRPMGSKLELPLWLVKGLFDNKRRILSVELPKIYQEGWRTVFSADANVVDLHKMGPHFYGYGSQLLHFDSPENADISQSLLRTFIGRFRRIMDSSQNTYNEDTSALVAKLDEMERGLFQTGQKGLNNFQCWEKGQASQITPSNLVQNYKKRKFTDMED